MTRQNPETEIAVLKEQTRVFDKDLNHVQDTLQSMDSKLEEIRELLSEQYVTKKEFEVFKSQQNTQKLLVGVITSVMTAVIVFEIMRVID